MYKTGNHDLKIMERIIAPIQIATCITRRVYDIWNVSLQEYIEP